MGIYIYIYLYLPFAKIFSLKAFWKISIFLEVILIHRNNYQMGIVGHAFFPKQ
jgi:hypothetical protein